MRDIKYLVVHCTATPQNTKLESIQNYWKNTLGWKNPGYHYVIHPDGTITALLPEEQISNGVAGYNSVSINVSYIGGVDVKGKAVDNRTPAQKTAIEGLLKKLRKKYPKAKIQGHRDFPGVKKDCPCFNAIPEYANI